MIKEVSSTMDFCCACRKYRQTFREDGRQICVRCSMLRYQVGEQFIIYSKAKWWLIRFDGQGEIHVTTKSTEYSDVVDVVGNNEATALVFRSCGK